MNKLTIDDLNLFPDFSTYSMNLEKLDKYDFSNLSNEEIYNIYYDFATILPFSYGIFKPAKFNQHKFYRARLNINNQKEDISLIQTYSYPPNYVCTEKGRANLNGKSVFYCSNNPNAAILECKPKIGDEGYLSIWKGNSTKSIKTGICLPWDLSEKNIWNLMAKDSFNHLMKTLPSESKNKFNHFIALYKFINHKFITEEKPYPLTSMISNEMLYGDLHRDFIIYPSVIAEALLCNMAFHPNSVNENLKFEKVIKFKVVNLKNNEIELVFGKVGQLENTKMIWKNNRLTELENMFSKEKPAGNSGFKKWRGKGFIRNWKGY